MGIGCGGLDYLFTKQSNAPDFFNFHAIKKQAEKPLPVLHENCPKG